MNKDFLKQIADPDFVEGLLEYLRSKIGQARSHGRMRRKWPNKREHNGLVLFWSAPGKEGLGICGGYLRLVWIQ